ncbi:MAG: aminotransferase class I/II-fold pyridoxal phosphate-dependent enzyme [Pseudomonadales bacterium]|nr:aminotransferase class I/II-fold pyridoxal phosphate-dependent enzyme [Pseudomonadales bacterium]
MYADRLNRIAPFRVMELMERAKALEADGHTLVHFEVGEPDFPTAPSILAAGHRALDEGHTKYTQALGIPALRRRIAAYYEAEIGVEVDPQRVIVTSGASGGLLLLSALLLNPGDELLMADPGYPCNEVFVGLVNGVPVRLPVTAARGFQLQPEQIAARWSAVSKGVLLASPANPTGVVMKAAVLDGLIDITHRLGGVVVLDEIYQGLTYGATAEYRSGLALNDDLFVLNSFSKYFGMTGWRLGWMVVPEHAREGIARLAQNLFISPSSIAQHAALAAFEPEAMADHEARRMRFASRRDRLLAGLRQLGFAIPVVPAGAFYLYVDIGHTGMDANTFCWRLINEFQVAVTPGVDFGSHEAERYVRFAYTTSEASIELGLERISLALQTWGVA